MLAEEEKQQLKKKIEDVNSIFRLAGFELTNDMSIIQEAILDGKINAQKLSEEMVAFAKEHKSLDDFLKSKGLAK